MADIKTNQNKNNTIYISGGNKSGNIEVTNNNAKYFSDKSLEYSNNAKESAEEAKQHAENAENSKNTILNDSGFIAVSNNLKTSDTIGVVANNISNVNYVGENIEYINDLVESLNSLGDTATESIAIVAGDIKNVNTTATNINSVNKVANSISSVNNIATNLTEVLNSKTYANNAKTSATSAQTYANNSLTYSNNALNSADLAQEWAVSSSLVENTDYSSKYYANQAKTNANIATNQANIATNQANEAITTLNSTLDYSVITNCLLEVPQKINLELTDGVLTLKAGSKVIVPYGTEDLSATYPIGSTFLSDNFKVVDNEWNGSKFTIWVELQTDIIGGYTGYTFTGSAVVNFTQSAITIDGTTINPDATGNFIYYNAGEYKVTHAGTTGDTTKVFSLPIGIVDMDSTIGVNAIKQVFNGFGYIGSTWWVDKGVKGLVPNGRNADGSLKNIEKTTEKITIATAGTGSTTFFIFINFEGAARNAKNTTHYEQNEKPTFSETYGSWYNPKENKIYFYNNGVLKEVQYAMVGKITTSDGVAQSITTKNPFRAVDYDDAVLKRDLVEVEEALELDYIAALLAPDWSSSITVSSMPYTAPSYGWWLHYGINVNGSVAINGVGVDQYSYANNNWPGHQSVQILLSPGDVVSVASGSAPATKRFIPCKGV